MDFASRQLEKYGWSTGQGLGAKKGMHQASGANILSPLSLLLIMAADGITRAVRLGWKNDSAGLVGSDEHAVYTTPFPVTQRAGVPVVGQHIQQGHQQGGGRV